MSKYYSYSVKEELTKYFPGDTIKKMRMHKEKGSETDIDHMIALAWAYADTQAIGLFLTDHFLKETVLCDDYIVYIAQTAEKAYAYISFLHFEDNVPFDLDPGYAYEICLKWQDKGYDTVIMRNCVGVDKHNNGTFGFVTHSCNEMGTDFLIPVKVNNRYIFVRDIDPFWQHAEALFCCAVKDREISEYESLFTDDAVIARCPIRSEYEIANNKYEKAETFVSGVYNIKEYFNKRQAPSVAYIKGQGSSCYNIFSVSGQNYYVMITDYRNQIFMLIEEKIKDTDTVIPVPPEQTPQYIPMPAATSVRPLDVKTMHAYAIQMVYSDGCVKNFYLYNIDTADIPDGVVINGHKFDEGVLRSVRMVTERHREGVVFSNGYYIPAHILYYRGVAQLVPQKIDTVAFENNHVRLTGVYRIPLKVRRGGFAHTSVPRKDALYGANEALIDKDGNRLSDYSGYYIDNEEERTQFFSTKSEVNDKIGYLKKDGTWLAPPIFDEGEDFDQGHCVKVKIDGRQYLVNEYGEVIPFDYEVHTDWVSDDLYEFSTKKYEGEVTYPEEEYFDELSPGLWGFIDKYGKIVIEPQYVFTSGFHHIGNRAFVAKIVDGKTRWGLIDRKGNEIIPCIYPNLATHSGTAVNFQREENGEYGIMDFDGKILMEPRYEHICEYDKKHNLIAAGTDWNKCGVARVSDGKVIVPFEYEYIEFQETFIECETAYGGSAYYDYNGIRLSNDFNSHRWERNGNIGMWKDHKCGAVDAEGNIVIPFIFDESVYMDYYERGYLVTGTEGERGLSKLDGTVILPQKYSDIKLKDEFVIASYEINGCNIRDELFLTDGTPVFDDLYRGVHIDGSVLTRETLLGKEYYCIERF